MMGVYIKGMEMPQTCGDCLFYGLESAGNGMYWDYCRRKRDLIDAPDTERLRDCPLIEVPPHGRLIDADMMEQEVCSGCKNKEHRYENCIDCALANTPTVIEAEEDK